MLMVGTEAWVTRWGQNKQHPGRLLRRSTTESSRLAPTLQPASALPKMPQERSVLHKQLQAHYGFLWCLSCSCLSINSTTNRASGPGFSQFIQQIFIEPLVSTVCQAQGAFSCLWPLQAYDGTPTGQISDMSFTGSFWAPVASGLMFTVTTQVAHWFSPSTLDVFRRSQKFSSWIGWWL